MKKPVCIAGAGWAGLAAAVELSRKGIPVTVYESAQQIGGRARSFDIDGKIFDNGQHLMIGAYHQMLDMLKTVGVSETEVFLRIPQQLKILDLESNSVAFELNLPRLPSPFHLLAGILNCSFLNWKEKLLTLVRFDQLLKTEIQEDINVNQWLEHAGLPDKYLTNLLKPLCLAALTTHPQQASAKIFQNVLNRTFNGPASNTDLLIPKTDLGNIFPAAAKTFIESHGGTVLTQHRLEQIHIENKKVTSIKVNGQTHAIENLILATPAHASYKLLQPYTELDHVGQQLNMLEYEPTATVYLQYENNISLELPMLGLLNSTAEWVFEGKQCSHPDRLAVVISASGEHSNMSKQALADKVAGELSRLIPGLPRVVSSTVIREKRASLHCGPDIDKSRPSIKTGVDNFYLCGDYVYIEENNHPGLPSTLEGAIACGVKCSQLFIQD